MPPPVSIEEYLRRFHAQVAQSGPNECWQWTGKVNRRGYGLASWGRHGTFAHRLAYMIEYGDIPKGLVVRHTCDNKPCVNPRHLLIGTYAQNTQDALDRNLIPIGSRCPSAVLDEAQVQEVRAMLAAGYYQREVAARFGVSQSNIHKIARGKTWKHVGAA